MQKFNLIPYTVRETTDYFLKFKIAAAGILNCSGGRNRALSDEITSFICKPDTVQTSLNYS